MVRERLWLPGSLAPDVAFSVLVPGGELTHEPLGLVTAAATAAAFSAAPAPLSRVARIAGSCHDTPGGR